MANILHVCGWFDPSGDATRCVAELNKYSNHKHDLIVKWRHPVADVFQFPEPVLQSPIAGIVSERFEWADAIIHHLVGWDSGAGYKLNPDKPTAFRNANVMYNPEQGKFYCLQEFFANPFHVAYRLVGSCHMGARDFMGEQAHYLPALIPINEELYTPDWSHREPCVAYIKHSPEITSEMSTTPNLRRLDLTGQRLVSVLHMRRREATVTIDNLSEGHYGLAGTESLAQGIPVVAWNHPRTLAQLNDIAPGAGSPFIQASNIREAVVLAKEFAGADREVHGRIAREWIETFYNSKYLIERYWEPFCDRLVNA